VLSGHHTERSLRIYGPAVPFPAVQLFFAKERGDDVIQLLALPLEDALAPRRVESSVYVYLFLE
jgi:hypothetical protein